MYHYRPNTAYGAFQESDTDSFVRDWSAAEPERGDQVMKRATGNGGLDFGTSAKAHDVLNNSGVVANGLKP